MTTAEILSPAKKITENQSETLESLKEIKAWLSPSPDDWWARAHRAETTAAERLKRIEKMQAEMMHFFKMRDAPDLFLMP